MWATDPKGTGSVGFYNLTTTLAPVAPVAFDQLTQATLGAGTTRLAGQLMATEDALTQFALTATGGTAGASAVRVTLLDATGRTVFTTNLLVGQPAATGAVWQ